MGCQIQNILCFYNHLNSIRAAHIQFSFSIIHNSESLVNRFAFSRQQNGEFEYWDGDLKKGQKQYLLSTRRQQKHVRNVNVVFSSDHHENCSFDSICILGLFNELQDMYVRKDLIAGNNVLWYINIIFLLSRLSLLKVIIEYP